ncbi:MAG: type II toxin-antitoxin system RelE/ParE family toxin [Rickettsiaceae bacterium]|jgi:mRNA-degrading endonuclease RelE of RelBE toxin-antitoxin system|nr:type II toxin-antitoxin system RelE/ParE family toxin [Rickettsiaceae bacterium]MDP5083229.1 type II toxin-antitoxin system RelE/ParE family toxin [Rickettsiaceae bacterium]
MEIIYNILYQDAVIKNHIPKLSGAAKLIIKTNIESKLALNPIAFGKPLRYSLKGHRRLRVGDYRIIYRIQDCDVIIIAIKHRKDIYD